MTDYLVLGPDIGGSHIAAAQVNIHTKQIEIQTEIRRPVKADAKPRDLAASFLQNGVHVRSGSSSKNRAAYLVAHITG